MVLFPFTTSKLSEKTKLLFYYIQCMNAQLEKRKYFYIVCHTHFVQKYFLVKWYTFDPSYYGKYLNCIGQKKQIQYFISFLNLRVSYRDNRGSRWPHSSKKLPTSSMFGSKVLTTKVFHLLSLQILNQSCNVKYQCLQHKKKVKFCQYNRFLDRTGQV